MLSFERHLSNNFTTNLSCDVKVVGTFAAIMVSVTPLFVGATIFSCTGSIVVVGLVEKLIKDYMDVIEVRQFLCFNRN